MNCSACGETHTGASGWCPKHKIHTLMCFSVDGPMPLEMAGWAFQTGAAVAFGLMGMAEAIRWNYLCSECGKHVGPFIPAGPLSIKCWCFMSDGIELDTDDRSVDRG